MPTIGLLAQYDVTLDVVKITFQGGESVHMNAGTLKVVIDNIHRTRAHYATEEAFQSALNVYETALRLVNGGAE